MPFFPSFLLARSPLPSPGPSLVGLHLSPFPKVLTYLLHGAFWRAGLIRNHFLNGALHIVFTLQTPYLSFCVS